MKVVSLFDATPSRPLDGRDNPMPATSATVSGDDLAREASYDRRSRSMQYAPASRSRRGEAVRGEYSTASNPTVHLPTPSKAFLLFNGGCGALYQHCAKATFPLCRGVRFRYSNREATGVATATGRELPPGRGRKPSPTTNSCGDDATEAKSESQASTPRKSEEVQSLIDAGELTPQTRAAFERGLKRGPRNGL